jgi:hypothetical protein
LRLRELADVPAVQMEIATKGGAGGVAFRDARDPKCLLLRAVLFGVSPVVAGVFAVPDDLAPEELHEVLQLTLGWERRPFYRFRVHGQEITQRRQLRTRRLWSSP